MRGGPPTLAAPVAALIAALALAGGCSSDPDDGPIGIPDGAPASDPVEDPGDAPAGAPAGVDASGVGSAAAGDDPTLRPNQVTETGGDGTRIVTVQGYDGAGLLRVEETFVGGATALTSRYSHDADGRIATRVDTDADGGLVATVAYAYGPDGAQSARERFDADGALVERLGYDFDADGLVEAANRVRLAFEDGTPLPGEGQLVERTEYAYAGGRLASESIDRDADGAPDAVRDYAYAADGTLESTAFTDAAEGTTSVAAWRYEAGPCTLAWANSLFTHFCVTPDAAD